MLRLDFGNRELEMFCFIFNHGNFFSPIISAKGACNLLIINLFKVIAVGEPAS